MGKEKSSPPLKKSTPKSGLGYIIGAVVGLVVVVVALVGAGLWLLNYGGPGQASMALPENISPERLAAHREAAAAQLNSYRWVDQEAEVVRIPIQQAMAVIAEQGLPVGEPPTPTATPTPEVTVTPEPAISEEPDEAATPIPPLPTVDLANVSFQANVRPILERSCFQCHGGERPEGGQRIEEGLILLTVEDILTGSWNGSVVEPGDVTGSYLVEQVATGRMPKEGERLTEAEIEVISAWIEAGAPDN